ncbi:2-hydroxyacid dehydrogenase [Noviherbaspirillum aerium]|uniref:2-hydroxyacid dehydrogenase n=1 Tax=Noviherbaspirillum aerium TaxID=2588497 RepID=UPI00124EAFEA|nr:2-hydroxyacid dehydrogenase [Noviherbaspirillum aerium]
MKKRILQNGRLLPALETALAEEYDLHPLWREPEPAAYLRQHGASFDGLVTSAPVGADAALLQALPNLKIISSFGVGFDKLDLDMARERKIRVGYTPNVLNDCVADLAFGMMIDIARGIAAADRFVRRGDWLNAKFPIATRISGKRLGIVGLGRIGQAIARRAGGFDMEIAYTNLQPVEGFSYRHEPSLAGLAAWADFLVVSVAGGAQTRHLISRDVLAALGQKGFLINVSRGTVVDEEALVDALVGKTIAGAALDVFANEPHVPARLLECDNVLVLPHIASGTAETRAAMADLVLSNLRAHFSGKELVTPLV